VLYQLLSGNGLVRNLPAENFGQNLSNLSKKFPD
jgi:hypothetical protein